MVWYRRHIIVTAQAHAGSVASPAQSPTLGDDFSHPPPLKHIPVCEEKSARWGLRPCNTALTPAHAQASCAGKQHTKTKCTCGDLMCCAGVLGWLVLHSRSIFPSREDQERDCPPPHRRLQHDFGCALIRPRGATQASTSAGLGVVKAWENHGRDPESWASEVRETRRKLLPSLYWSRVQTAKHPLGVVSSRRTRQISEPSLWMPCSLRLPQFWSTLPRSSRCSWRRCSRLRLLSGSSGASCSLCRQRSRRARWFPHRA